jgi:hypothetical protein
MQNLQRLDLGLTQWGVLTYPGEFIMNRILSYCAGAVALLAIPAAANATTLFDQTNFSATNTPESFTFIAGATSTTLAFGGYQVPSWMNLDDIFLVLTGDTTNLLATSWNFTAAASCSGAWESVAPGAYGTNGLRFGDYCEGQYDTFSQSIGTTIGNSYTVGFILSNPNVGDVRDAIEPSGLRVTASDAVVAAVPEPATWAMMLMGFGAIGIAMRFRRRRPLVEAG